MTNLKVGDKIPSIEAMESLPVGVAVTTRRGRKLVTRHPDGWAQHADDRLRHTTEHYWWDGIEIVSLPPGTYSGPMIGDRITSREQLDQLPDGALISRIPGGQTRLEKQGESWNGYEADYMWDQYVSKQPFVVETLPVDLFETPEQFAWRFRDLSITGAERALNSPSYATEVLDGLGIKFTPSVGMRVTNTYDRKFIPNGSRVYVGDPEQPETFGLWVRDGGRWNLVFGQGATPPENAVAVVIDTLPDRTEPDEWFVAQPTPEQIAEVQQLKATVWKAGWAKKTQHGWCSEYERIMLRGGLTADVALAPLPGGVKVGDVLTPEQAALLPVGTVLRGDENGEWAVFRRVENATNRAGTALLAESPGWNGHHFHPLMKLMTHGTEGLRTDARFIMEVHSTDEMDQMPLGTQITTSARATVYQKVPLGQVNRHWADLRTTRTAQHAHEAFWAGRICSYYYIRIGEDV